jgi:hypothetical protein
MEDQRRERTGVSADSKAGLHHRCFACSTLIGHTGFCAEHEAAWLHRLAEADRRYVRRLREWGGAGHEAQAALVAASYNGTSPAALPLYADCFDAAGFTEWSRGHLSSVPPAAQTAAVEPPGQPTEPDLPLPPRGRRRSAGMETA